MDHSWRQDCHVSNAVITHLSALGFLQLKSSLRLRAYSKALLETIICVYLTILLCSYRETAFFNVAFHVAEDCTGPVHPRQNVPDILHFLNRNVTDI